MNKRDKAIEKLNQLAQGNESKWLVEAKERLSRDEGSKEWSQLVGFRVLRKLRSNKRMGKHPQTQVELAEILGVKQQQVNKWVKGRENLTLGTVRSLQSALGIRIVNFNDDVTVNPRFGIVYSVHGQFSQYKVNNVVHSSRSETKVYTAHMSNSWSAEEELVYECE